MNETTYIIRQASSEDPYEVIASDGDYTYRNSLREAERTAHNMHAFRRRGQTAVTSPRIRYELHTEND